jgi:zinc transporter 9
MAASGSKKAVFAAIVGNTFVMIAKFLAFFFTGASSMLSEAIHTLADVLNQILLMVGIVRSDKNPDEDHAYGYMAERYIWALISAVGIFFLGCGVTMYHGIETLIHHLNHHGEEGSHQLKDLNWAIGVLIFSLILEGYVLWVALKQALKQAAGKPLFKFLMNDADPAVVAVVLEDAAACLGVIIALVAIIIYQYTGNPYIDPIASIMIGLLLGAVAIWLVWRNSSLLIGVSVPAHIRQQVEGIIKDNPAVEEIVDMKTRIMDTETYRIKADLRFDGEALADKLSEKLKPAYEQINTYDDFQAFARDFADDVVDLLADEIDSIEKQIQAKIPQARHMDFEAD